MNKSVPLAFTECCPCPDHPKIQYASLSSGSPTRLAVYEGPCKSDSQILAAYPNAPVYIEGTGCSLAKNDAQLAWDWQGENCAGRGTVTYCTVFGLRLVPDLDADGGVGVGDLRLVRQMPPEIGWGVTPRKRCAVLLKNGTRLGGDFSVSIASCTNGAARLYSETNLVDAAAVSGGAPAAFANDGANRLYYLVAEPGVAGEIVASFAGSGGNAGCGCAARLKFTAVDLRVAGDGGPRDQQINFDDPDDTNVVFWVNNDYDVLHNRENEESYHEDDRSDCNNVPNCDDDVIGSVEYVYNRNYVVDFVETNYCYRDLEDFDRLHIRVPDVLTDMEGLTYEFKLFPSSPDGIPSINLFKAVQSDLFYINATNDYTAINQQMMESRLLTVGNAWTAVSGDDYVFLANNHFLYEGKTEGKGILKFRVRLDEIVLAEASTAVELRDASAFTDTYEIPHTPLTLATVTNEWDVAVGEYYPTHASVEVPWNSGTNVTLLVLGWNVDEAEKSAWRDTMFKRLFWQGYRGRVAAFHWPAQYGFSGILEAFFDGPHFDRSEHRAWLSASKAAVLLSELLAGWGKVTIVAHSQGNVVASEALNCISYTESQNTNRVTYIALQSAISAQYFDTAFQADSVTNQLDVFSLEIRLAKSLGDLWRLIMGATSPDIQGHFPNGLDIDPPYLHGIIPKFGRTVNFYNRMDYALNIWVANNATKPDDLAYDFTYDKSACGYYRQVDPNPVTGIDRVQIFPASDLRARWCVFAFVAYTRALAAGQLDMTNVFKENINLQGPIYGFDSSHYSHSFEFRSNVIDTCIIWENILKEMRK